MLLGRGNVSAVGVGEPASESSNCLARPGTSISSTSLSEMGSGMLAAMSLSEGSVSGTSVLVDCRREPSALTTELPPKLPRKRKWPMGGGADRKYESRPARPEIGVVEPRNRFLQVLHRRPRVGFSATFSMSVSSTTTRSSSRGRRPLTASTDGRAFLPILS